MLLWLTLSDFLFFTLHHQFFILHQCCLFNCSEVECKVFPLLTSFGINCDIWDSLLGTHLHHHWLVKPAAVMMAFLILKLDPAVVLTFYPECL